MKQKRASNALAFIAGLWLAAVMLLATFLSIRPVAADAGKSGLALSVAATYGSAEPLLTSANGYTAYLPLIRRTEPFTFYDGFTNPASGWPIHLLNLNEPYPPGPWSSGYGKEKINNTTTTDNDVYNVKTVAAWNSWIYTAPVVLAAPTNFYIQVDGKSAQEFMWASSWGLYFNANAGRTQFYTLQIFQDSDGVSHPTLEVRRWVHFQGDADDPNFILVHRRCISCQREDFAWTQIRVQRIGATLYIYAGGLLLNIIDAPEYTSGEYNGVGVYQGNFEFNDFNPKRYGEPAFQFDNFILWPALYRE